MSHPHSSIAAGLAADRVLLLDGGTGSELARRGLPLRHDVWSALAAATHPELLRETHADFIAAGADVITTNTFATSRFVLAAAGFDDLFERLNRGAVDAARSARDAAARDVVVAGSVSCLPPRFDVRAYPNPAAESAGYRELAELLVDAGVDLIALEMLEDVEHAKRACEAVSALGVPVWLGVSCRRASGKLVAFDFPDTPLETVLDALLPYEPAAVNVMHSPPDAIDAALAVVASRWHGPFGAYPELARNAAGYRSAAPDERSSPSALAAQALGWRAAGARLVGGCCGTTPAHIRALREALDRESAAA